MAYTVNKLLEVAVAEIGYREKASNSMLDDKTANSGSGNWTKYARDFDEKWPDWYNGKKNGYAWCDMFVDWCFLQAFGYKAALYLLCQPEHSAGAGCLYSAQYYKSAGCWYSSNPQAGDQIFFTSNGEVSHTGIVESVSGNTVRTIEGNTSDSVARRTYQIGSSYIYGYGRPRYDSIAGGSSVPAGEASTVITGGSRATVRKGDYNDSVRELQEKLTYLGYNVGGVDGDFGNNTLAAVIEFQRQNGLEVDGIVGALTWAALDVVVSAKKASMATVKVGDTVSIVPGATYYNGKAIPSWVTAINWVVASVSGDRAVVNVSSDGKYRINSPVNVKYLNIVSAVQTPVAVQPTQSSSAAIAVGDIVNFTGSKHYVSSGAKSGGACKPGKAKVTQIYGLGTAAHPYHLVAVAGGGATVHGWVDADTIQKV